MGKLVKVYRYYKYDVISNENISPPAYATMEFIKTTKGLIPIEASVMEVAFSQIDSDGRYFDPGK